MRCESEKTGETDVASDWQKVYRQECQRPAYVIANGKSTVKLHANASQRRDVKPPEIEKRTVA